MPKKIIQIRVHGRGGQGVVTAAELIAMAAFYEGNEAQAFPFFGVERSGAPIMSFARISKNKIKTREQIYAPDYLIIQDETLIDDQDVLIGSHKETKLIINSTKTAKEIFKSLKKSKIKLNNIFSAAATEIALEFLGKNIVNTVILGALAKHSKLFSLTSLNRAVTEKLAAKGERILQKNLAAITKIYESN